MAFRFVHTADIHLDSPLRSLALRNPELAELVGDASRQAFIAVVDLCLAEQVDALVIAGDLYDGDQTSMKTARFLGSQMTRLHQAGIRVYVIRGNHDAMSRITKQLVLPDTVTIFGGRCQSVIQPGAGVDVAFHGLSFANPKAPESLLPKYAAPQEGAANIGIMHTSLAGSPAHDVYAPCSVAELNGHGFDYWALGHIHVRQVHSGASTLVMPGIPQGRDINEAGQKSVTLVTIRDDHSVETEERLTSVAHALLHSARQFVGILEIPSGQLNRFDRLTRNISTFGLWNSSNLESERHIVADVAVRHQRHVLEHHADLFCAKLPQLFRAHGVYVPVLNINGPVGRLDEPVDVADQR